MALKF
jgi:hypothetical protein